VEVSLDLGPNPGEHNEIDIGSTGDDPHVTLYGLRHRYGLMGIKNGVNLKLLSLCMGHARTQMTEHYIAEAGLTQQVQKAARQVVCQTGGGRF
jgi:integrase